MATIKRSKPIFKKLDLTRSCWYACGKKADGTFNFANGDEIPVCFNCARKKGKTKGQRRNMMSKRVKPEQTILEITDKAELVKIAQKIEGSEKDENNRDISEESLKEKQEGLNLPIKPKEVNQ